MCGIFGFFSRSDPSFPWEGAARRALRNLSHRGPDGSGLFCESGVALGHTRLAVLDVTDAGSQPMRSPDGRHVISFNGEIYNFKDLRAELETKGHSFRSRSDTEVLLRAWIEWGEKTLDKLDGIFAFAVLDRQERRLFLARDHLGVKPLFYYWDGERFGFASELLGLFGPEFPCPAPDSEDLDAYFTFNYLPAPRSGLKNVRQLPPGHTLRVDARGIEARAYWSLSYAPVPETYGPELIERFSELVRRSCAAQLVADVPLGVFLSGGLDSFAVAQAASEGGMAHATAYTMGFDQKAFDETDDATRYAAHLGIDLAATRFVWSEEEIRATLGVMRELHADASNFPMHQLSRFTRKSATVALSGDGGDELLAGYDTYKAGSVTAALRLLPPSCRSALRLVSAKLPSRSRRYGWRMVCERLLLAAEEGRGRDHASFRRIFTPALKRRLFDPDFFKETRTCDPIAAYAGLMEDIPPERSWLTARQHADVVFHLPAILAKVDRMSMATGLEVRVPLLSRDMVEFCANLPDAAKRSLGKGKRILREHLRGKIPRDGLSRAKAGFLPPLDQAFAGAGPLREVLAEALEWAKPRLGWLNWNEVGTLWQEHRRGQTDAGFVLLGILQFINWNRHRG